MKLLSATSFFLFFILITLIFSCEPELNEKNMISEKAYDFELKAYNFSNRERKYDSAIFYAEKALKVALEEKNNLSIKSAFDRLILYYSKTDSVSKAFNLINNLYDYGEKQKDSSLMAVATFRRGYIYNTIEKFEEAYKNFVNAKGLFLKIGDSVEVAKKLLVIAELEKKLGSFGASQSSALEGLKYIKNNKDIITESKLYYIVSVAAKEQGDLLTAEQRINQALILGEKSKKIKLSTIITYSNTKANLFKEQGLYEQAIKVYEDLLTTNKDKLIARQLARVNGNLAHAIYMQEGKKYNKKSDSLLRNSLKVYKKIKYKSGLHSIYLKLAELYKEKNKLKAIEYIDKSIHYARKIKNNSSINEALEIKIGLSYNDKDFKEYKSIQKLIKKKEYAVQSLIANVKFDFENEENKRIKAENKAINEKNKASTRLILILLLLLSMVLLLVAIFFIYQQIKRRHKIEKVKTVHNTEVRISTKVHDELANDIHNLLAQVETSDPDKSLLLDKLDTIYNNARDISKQNRSVETGEGFSDELANLFRSYQSDAVNIILKRYDMGIWSGISSHIKVTIYRVLQELLTNMKKHSNATLVAVSIEKMNKELFIQFKDNGKGFSEGISKNGLLNAENRIHAIKGTLTFDTKLHQGCKFSINVPL